MQAERISLHRQVAALQRGLAASQAAQQELGERLEAALMEAAGCRPTCVSGHWHP